MLNKDKAKALDAVTAEKDRLAVYIDKKETAMGQ